MTSLKFSPYILILEVWDPLSSKWRTLMVQYITQPIASIEDKNW
jgi:hypothetical protein